MNDKKSGLITYIFIYYEFCHICMLLHSQHLLCKAFDHSNANIYTVMYRYVFQGTNTLNVSMIVL